MKFPLISAGEFFELLRPAAYVLSVVLSIWVLASARRRGYRWFAGLAWALGTFFLPFVVLPFFLICLIFISRPSSGESAAVSNSPSPSPSISYRFLLPTVYGSILLIATGVYLYRDHNTVDAHLARAAQAKLSSKSAKTIREYRAALSLEDNSHTHKLLGIELAEAGQWTEALNEFRLAERGGEPDELLPFRIAQVLKASGQHSAAVIEYQRFLNSHACTQQLPDSRCEVARRDL